MSADTLLVSTRKGLFVWARAGAGWKLDHHAFPGDSVTLTLVDPRDGQWYAAMNLGHFGCKLKRSADRGRSWTECAVPAYGEDDIVPVGDGKETKVAALKLIWSLAAGDASQPGRLWAGTIPGGLFKSDDLGESWQLQRELWKQPERGSWFGGGYDEPGIHSICVDPRDPRCVRVAVSTGGVWRSDDDGESWEQTAHGMRACYMPEGQQDTPNSQDVHQMVQCRSAPERFWVQHHCGVFRSDSNGGDWQEITSIEPSAFGFAVAVHPDDPDTAWFVPGIKDECRLPVDAKLVVARTRDGGNSFDVLREGLPQEHAYDLVYRHGLTVSDDGNQLAFGSTTGGVWTSDDQGDHWQMLPARLPMVHAVCFA